MQSYVHAHARTCTHMHVRMCMQVRGQLTAMVVYFTLDLNGEPSNILNTGPDSPNMAWDQALRFLPAPLHVQVRMCIGGGAMHMCMHVCSVCTHMRICMHMSCVHVPHAHAPPCTRSRPTSSP